MARRKESQTTQQGAFGSQEQSKGNQDSHGSTGLSGQPGRQGDSGAASAADDSPDDFDASEDDRRASPGLDTNVNTSHQMANNADASRLNIEH